MELPTPPVPDFRIGDIVLYKDHQVIAFNKPPGIPVQKDKTGDKALVDLAEIYTKCRLELVHRIDRPASGLVLFAKTHNALVALHEQFQTQTIRKIYLAVVKNLPPEMEGTLVHYLKKNSRSNRSSVSETSSPDAREAVLRYKYVASIEHYHLLQIELLSGRHHQIRAQLAHTGCPVKGDVKYGFPRGNKDRSIHLHAWKLEFSHPSSQKRMELIAPTPKDPVWQAFDLSET